MYPTLTAYPFQTLTIALTAEVAESKTAQDAAHHDKSSYVLHAQTPCRCCFFGGRRKIWDFCQNLCRHELGNFLFAVDPRISEFKTTCHDSTDEDSKSQAHERELQSIRRKRLRRRTWRIENAEVLPLLALFKVGRHLGLIFFGEKRIVVLPRLLVVAGDFRQLLFSPRALF